MKQYYLTIIIALLSFIFGWLEHDYYQNSSKILFLSADNARSVGDNRHIKKRKLTLLEKIKKRKHLDVVILNAPTVYYVGETNRKGFEYDLLADFAKSIEVDLNLTIVSTVQEALKLTQKGIGDITAAALTVNNEYKKEFNFGPYYNTITEQLICHNSLYKKGIMPKSIDDLAGLKIEVGKQTHYETTLSRLKTKIEGFDYNTSQLSTEQLLEKVWKKEIDCTVADSHIFMISQRYYPELVRVITLSDKRNLAWIIQKGDDSLNEALFRWLNKYERSGKMAELQGFYFDFLDIFDYFDTKVFYKRLKTTLPKYERYFKKAGKKYNIPWMVLAAQSYQESHWKPSAKSYTGVRGMMMLTNETAKILKVKNRLNAGQSIDGGAKYFDMMRKLLPDDLDKKNLWAISLAAYNIGIGHIYDAQILAKKLNKNPYSWNDLKVVLPLLSQKKYYKNLRYGYARGNEPVRYVDAIQHYYDIIVQSRMPKQTVKICVVPKQEDNRTKERNKTATKSK